MAKKRRKKTERQKLVEKLDKVFADVIKEAYDWTCLKCKKGYERKSPGLQCSHIFSRRHKSVRWHPDNACAKCTACHMWWHGNPDSASRWIRSEWGDGLLDIMQIKANESRKWYLSELKEMLDWYESELMRIQDMREQGTTGYIRVIPME